MNKNWKHISLDGEWQLFIAENCKIKGESLPVSISQLEASGYTALSGRVPGNFELDLQKAGMLTDLYFGTNPQKARKLENLHLFYARRFDTSDFEGECFLRFEGIDTFSEIYLNGKLIAETDNMLIHHDIEVQGFLRGENELVVHILPTAIRARENEMGAGILYHQPYNAESVTVRKPAHMYGWDIMPRILSGGIWRSVYLYERPLDRIENIYAACFKADKDRGSFHFYYKTAISNDFTEGYKLRITCRCKDSVVETERPLWHIEGRTFVHIEKPYLWWPKGMGEPNLYSFTVELYRFDELLDTTEFKAGLRTVRLERSETADSEGNGEFCFYVNGEPMFVKGTNWVPMDAFHSRDKERMPRALGLLDEVGCNMVRCWGGNVYEDHEFFDFCDSHGIAVWQDFAMACSYYPQTEEFASKLKFEAETVVKKLRNHPSIFLWAGDNECDITIAQWHPFRQDPNDNILTRRVLHEVIRNNDPFREYLPSSPFISRKAYAERKDRLIPEQHLWGPRKYFKADYYSKAVCHFASETGYHGCPDVESLREFLSEDKLWPWEDNLEWIAHATCMEIKRGAHYSSRIALMASQMTELFGIVPQNIEEFSVSSQITQAEADKYFIERFRLGKFSRTTGILWWNLLDGWPQFSDAVVDYYYRKKTAFEVIKRAQQTVCLMMREPENGKLTLAVSNDSLCEVPFIYKVTDTKSGKTVAEGSGIAPRNGVADVTSLDYDKENTVFYIIEWEINGESHKNHYLAGEAPLDYGECLKGYKTIGLLKD